MHKVVLACDSEAKLREHARVLNAAGVQCKLWIEQPENIATSIATQPLRRSALQPLFKEFRLMK